MHNETQNIAVGSAVPPAANLAPGPLVPAVTIPHADLHFDRVELQTKLRDDRDGSEVRVTRAAVKPTNSAVVEHTTYLFTVERDTDFDNTYSLLTLGIQMSDWAVSIDEVSPSHGTVLPGGAVIVGLVKGEAATEAEPLVKPQLVPATEKTWSAQNRRFLSVEDNIWLIQLAGAKRFTFKVNTVNRLRTGFTRWSNGTAGHGHDNTPPD